MTRNCISKFPLRFQNVLTALVGLSMYLSGAYLSISGYWDIDPDNFNGTVPWNETLPWNELVDVARLQQNAFAVGGLMAFNAVLVCLVGFVMAGYLTLEMGRKRGGKNGHAVSKGYPVQGTLENEFLEFQGTTFTK